MTKSKKILGRDGETVATYFLEQKGYVILKRNFTVRGGEIDVIAQFEDTIHFIEVKTRKSTAYGTPAMSVNSAKQKKILFAAKHYLNKNNLYDVSCAFDVIEIFKFPDGRFAVNMIENAFEE